MNIKNIFSIFFTATILFGCTTPKDFNFLQDLKPGKTIAIQADGTIRLRPGDELTILVKSKDPALAALFNNGLSSKAENGRLDANTYLSRYILDPEGNIDIPYLGKIHLKGLSRHETKKLVESKLHEGPLKDASITVEFLNMAYSVAGEVNSPGVFGIGKDNTDIFEALGRAGSLSVYGKRDSIIIIRQDGNTKKTYCINLTNSNDVYSSDAYYIHQNDLIYVKANDVKARQSKQNASELRSFSFWLSLLSVIATLSVLIFK